MQKPVNLQPSTMAAVLGLDNEVVETICNDTQGVVVAELQLPWTIGDF